MIALPPFKLESFFAQYEFSAPYLLCMSDAEPHSQKEVLALADSECCALWEELSLGYTETMGMPLLRAEIARQYPSLSSEAILCHAGAEEAIYCALQSLISRGDRVVVVTPCYQSLEAIPRALAAQVVTVPLDDRKGWKLDLDLMREALRRPTKMVILNYPHNPTGALLSHEDQKALVSMVRENGSYLLCDEVYRLMEHKEEDRLPPIADVYEKGISIGVMTKAFGLGGLRIGWMASPDIDVVAKVAEYKHYTSICNAAPSEVLALIALRNQETLLARTRKIMGNNLLLLDRFFASSSLFSWHRPKAGCIGFVKVKEPIEIESFTRELVDKAGILLLPASNYDYQGNYFRIGFGRRSLPDVLTRFSSYLEKRGLVSQA